MDISAEGLLKKIDNGVVFTDNELALIDAKYYHTSQDGDYEGMMATVASIVKLDNRYFRLAWDKFIPLELKSEKSLQPVEMIRVETPTVSISYAYKSESTTQPKQLICADCKGEIDELDAYCKHCGEVIE